MKILNKPKLTTIGKTLKIDLLESGDIFKIYYDRVMINGLKGNLIDGMVSNIYLKDEIRKLSAPLLGLKSNAKTTLLTEQILYEGEALGVNYEVTLEIKDNIYYYHVVLSGKGLYSLYFTQDVGLNEEIVILNNEAYNGQYLDHRILKNNESIVSLTRQNMGRPHLLQLGANEKLVSYSTDMLQFFGLSYKETNKPEALIKEELADEIMQYEMPFIALKTQSFKLADKKNITFYGLYIDEEDVILEEPMEVYFPTFTKTEKIREFSFKKANIKGQINGEDFTCQEINKQSMECKEEKEGELLSFFTGNHHYVLKKKELLTERPHGNIMLSGEILKAGNVFAVSNFIYGVFGSRIVLGNSNFHRLNGDVRNPLNLQTISGMRIYLDDNGWRLLALPSLYIVSASETKWLYKYGDDVIEITYQVALNDLKHRLTFKSHNDQKYRILITNQIVIGEIEYNKEINVDIKENRAIINFKSNDFVSGHYPDLKYQFTSKGIFGGEEILFNDQVGMGLLTILFEKESNFIIGIDATLNEFNDLKIDYENEKLKYENFLKKLINLELKSDDEEIIRFKKLLYWYTHNALIHYASPHGLEQTSGAAWGTRDILQGPVELFTALRRFDIVRDILLKVYSRQFKETASWPQWFMFDKYYKIQAHDAHGDIIVWGIKALSEYIINTNDFTILDEKVSYFSLETNDFTNTDTILNHLKKQFKAIKNEVILNTYLPKYDGGDWNDTLQPKEERLKDVMASSWTIALLYQALKSLKVVVKEVSRDFYQEIKEFNKKMKADYQRYLIKDDIPAGFVIIDDKITRLLHPSDLETKISYRLLSLQRAIISEIVSKDKRLQYLDIIKKELSHPDGVRLMDKPVNYHYGTQTYFTRAETAANFGREIGIMYVHAHLRYIEALLKENSGKEALLNLEKVSPINITKRVKNANIRQANLYFSSSDAAYNNRYLAQENYHLVKEGAIKVKAGWRLYSSGPGLYLAQFINNLLGIKVKNNNLFLNPKYCFKGLEINFNYQGKMVNVCYYRDLDERLIVNGKTLRNENNEYFIGEEMLFKTNTIKVFLK
ncbi:MAG: hypothetical protein M0O92_04005 [Acholeplasmataceae bacterium]|nr:hypothetical protein [Acholeplasmataceae bacterium]